MFRYECEGVTIFDAPTAVKVDGNTLPILRRTFTFQSDQVKTLFFRAAIDAKIEKVAGLLRVGRFLDLRAPVGSFFIRETTAGDKPGKELLIEVPIARGRTQLVIDYARREEQK